MTADTRQILLNEAERLLRTRGYAAFSYADLAEKVGIRKASIHHHFPTKEALGAALIDGYLARFDSELAAILAETASAEARLSRYGAFFIASMEAGMMPLCGALSAENFVLPESLQRRVAKFFQMHLDWLEKVVQAGVADGSLKPGIDAEEEAASMLSAMEGASLVAWALRDPRHIEPTLESAIARLKR